MAWQGYIQYAGNEIINVSRTETYATNAGLDWFKPLFKNDSLPPMLGETYVSPAVDNAPWTDPDAAESYGFYGVFPLDIQGIEDSSRSSTVTESIGNGGNPGRLRHGTKTVVFNTVLIGEDDAAVDYGFRWLKQSLLSGPCGQDSNSDCSGDDLCYLTSEPMVDLFSDQVVVTNDGTVATTLDVDGGGAAGGGGTVYDGGSASDEGVVTTDLDGGGALGPTSTNPVATTVSIDPTDCLEALTRSLRKVVFNSGPTVTSKRTLSTGGEAWTVQFTAVAGKPWEYGPEVEVIEGFLDPAVTIPWAGGVQPEGGVIDLDGHIYVDTHCATPVFTPLQDPNCPAIVPPPLPPSIGLGCYTPPANWRRRQITIPKSYIPLWGEVVPKFSVHARHADLRNLRLRFYADVNGDGDISDDPCAFCGDIVVSYVPHGSTLVFDAALEQVYAVDSSQRQRRADLVVFSTDGTPFDWPVLTCGMGYIVTLDLPQTSSGGGVGSGPAPVFDLSLFNRVA